MEAMNLVEITDDVMGIRRCAEVSWLMAKIRSEEQAMNQINVVDGRWGGGQWYATVVESIVWCCGRGEVDECGRHGWMRLPCCLLGEEAVGVLCRYRSTYPTNSYVGPSHFCRSIFFNKTNSTDGPTFAPVHWNAQRKLEAGHLYSDPYKHK